MKDDPQPRDKLQLFNQLDLRGFCFDPFPLACDLPKFWRDRRRVMYLAATLCIPVGKVRDFSDSRWLSWSVDIFPCQFQASREAEGRRWTSLLEMPLLCRRVPAWTGKTLARPSHVVIFPSQRETNQRIWNLTPSSGHPSSTSP